MTFWEMLEYRISVGKFGFALADLLVVLLVFAAAKAAVWLARHVVLRRFFDQKKLDVGRQYAVTQFVVYFIFVTAAVVALESLGVSISVLLAGSAALMVGIGLGLQDSFKDLVSGFIILGEGTVQVGDVVEVDGFVATVRRIGLRTSAVETRDHVSILVPNSKLVVEKVTNWTHTGQAARFSVRVGVAYGSDVELVKRLLLQAVEGHPKLLAAHPAEVQFLDFGDSALLFEVNFFSGDPFGIDGVKSDVRFAIERLFRENGVEIPFPQRELRLKNGDVFFKPPSPA